MNKSTDFSKIVPEKSTQDLLKKVHETILSTGKGISARIFPLYIRYDKGEETVALLNFRGKNLEPGTLELGLNIRNEKRPKGFEDGTSMKYEGINCSIKLDGSKKINKTLLNTISLTKG